MTEIITFTIPGKPTAKGRPKFVRRGKFVSTYTPEKTLNYENMVKARFWQEYGTDYAPIETAVRVSISATFTRPKGHFGSGRNAWFVKESAPEHMTTKPDLDNIAKAITDALNGLAYRDDSQIAALSAEKHYGPCEQCEVTITANACALKALRESVNSERKG